MLKNSARNSAPYRSLNVKLLNTEKSTFLKPESRKMFLPIFPKDPDAGGVRTELPEAKQPPIGRSFVVMPPGAVERVPAAWATQFVINIAAFAGANDVP